MLGPCQPEAARRHAATIMKSSATTRPTGGLPIIKALPHLLLLAAIFFTTFLARIILAPLLPTVQAELDIGHRSAGNLFFILSAGYFVSLLSTSYLAGRFQHRNLIIGSCIGLGAVLGMTPFITTLASLQATVFLLGLSAGLYLPSGISAVTHLTRPSHWGRALAIHELAPNLAFILAPLAAELVLNYATWRLGLFIIGCGALLLGLMYTTHGRGTRFHGQMPDRHAARDLLRQPSLWLLIALFSLGISSTLGIYTMLPLYLVNNHGLDRGSANTMLAASRMVALPIAVLGGWMTDRLGPLPTMRMVFLLTGLATMALGFLKGPWLQGAVFCQPLLAVCFFPAGFSALSTFTAPRYRSIAVSLTIPAAFLIGGGAVPMVIGGFGDTGRFPLAFIVVGALIALGSGLTAMLPSFKG